MKFDKKFYIKCGIGLFVLIMLISSVYYVSPGYRGTLVTLGNVHQTSFNNGIGFKWLCRIIHSQRVGKVITLKEESELGEWMDKWLNYNTQSKQDKKLDVDNACK